MIKPRRYDWPAFWPVFWGGFGRMVAGMSVGFFALAAYIGTSSADFEGAVCAWVFVLSVSAFYGWSEGEVAALRAWRAEAEAEGLD